MATVGPSGTIVSTGRESLSPAVARAPDTPGRASCASPRSVVADAGTGVALLTRMGVMAEMTMLRFEDLAPFAEARQLARVTRDLALAAGRDDQRAQLAELASVALAALVAVTEALRAGDPHAELRLFRDGQAVLAELRAQAYDAYLARILDGPRFDALMADAARTGRELERAVQSARRRARLRIDET